MFCLWRFYTTIKRCLLDGFNESVLMRIVVIDNTMNVNVVEVLRNLEDLCLSLDLESSPLVDNRLETRYLEVSDSV